MIYWFIMGLGVWTSASCARLQTFEDATVCSVVRGFALGVLFWPACLVLLGLVSFYEEKEKDLRRVGVNL
jgi:hypothetical protein